MDTIVEARGLRRRFGRRLALDDVDLRVAPGEIVGLVGPNGSGKTTLLKLLSGFLRPHGGEVAVFGVRPHEAQALVMERARFAFAPPALFESLTPREHLRHLTSIRTRRMARVSAPEIESVLHTVGLHGRGDDRVGTFSFGMRQRLVLAQALLPRPDLLVLDEPTDGLDPLGILELRDLLRRLRAEHGIAILLSSHLLVEIEHLVDHMLVLAEGRTLFRGEPSELIGPLRTLRLHVDRPDAAGAVLREQGFAPVVLNGSVEAEDIELELPAGTIELDAASRLLAEHGVALRGYRVHRPSLEEALLERLSRR